MFDSALASTTAAIQGSLTADLPAILLIFGGLVALGIAVHYIRKWVGRK
jgi:hypothetical protein